MISYWRFVIEVADQTTGKPCEDEILEVFEVFLDPLEEEWKAASALLSHFPVLSKGHLYHKDTDDLFWTGYVASSGVVSSSFAGAA